MSLSCSICFHEFNDSDHKPMTMLQCSHTYCSRCILNLAECPMDKTKCEKCLPNYALLEILNSCPLPATTYQQLINGTENSNVPKLCRLTRPRNSTPYGFDFMTLRKNNCHIAINVLNGQPAQVAGVQENDFILEVNGRSVQGMEHENVIFLILTDPTQVDLLVVQSQFNRDRINDSKSLYDNLDTKETTKLCRLFRKNSNQVYGFDLKTSSNTPIKHRISNVMPQLPAYSQGLRDDDLIVAVNGKLIEALSHKQVVELIAFNRKSVELLVTANNSSNQSNITIQALGEKVKKRSSIKFILKNLF